MEVLMECILRMGVQRLAGGPAQWLAWRTGRRDGAWRVCKRQARAVIVRALSSCSGAAEHDVTNPSLYQNAVGEQTAERNGWQWLTW